MKYNPTTVRRGEITLCWPCDPELVTQSSKSIVPLGCEQAEPRSYAIVIGHVVHVIVACNSPLADKLELLKLLKMGRADCDAATG